MNKVFEIGGAILGISVVPYIIGVALDIIFELTIGRYIQLISLIGIFIGVFIMIIPVMKKVETLHK